LATPVGFWDPVSSTTLEKNCRSGSGSTSSTTRIHRVDDGVHDVVVGREASLAAPARVSGQRLKN